MARTAKLLPTNQRSTDHDSFRFAWGKGGVGKSRLAMVLVDYLQRQGRQVVIVEGDKSGADLAAVGMGG